MLSVKTPEEAYAVMEDAFPPRPGPEEAALSRAVVSSFMKADGILEIPQGTEGFPAGSRVQVRLLRPEKELAGEGLRCGAFRARLEALGGYRLEHSGPVRPNRPLPSPGSPLDHIICSFAGPWEETVPFQAGCGCAATATAFMTWQTAL